MSALHREVDWVRTGFGDPAGWSPRLGAAIALCLDSAAPTLLWWGPRMLQVHNRPARELLEARTACPIGTPAREAWADVWPRLGPVVQSVLNDGHPARSDPIPIGTRREDSFQTGWVVLACGALREDDDTIVGAFVTALETQQDEALARLRASKSRYRQLFDSTDQGFCIVEMVWSPQGQPVDFRFLEVNPAFERLTGFTRAPGRRIRELEPDIESRWFEIYGTVARTGQPVHFEEEAAALGRHYEVFACALGPPGSGLVAILFNDVTRQHRTRVELEATRRRLEEALATARMAYWEWDPQSDSMTASTSITELLGLVPGQVIDSSVTAAGLIHPQDAEAHRERLAAAVRTGEGWHGEFRIIRPRDGEIAWLEERATVTVDPDTGERHLTGLVWDVTERKRAALALIEADSRKNEFLATLAHELRNPLAPLRNGVHLARHASVGRPAFEPVVDMMERQLSHLVRLVDDLLDLGRISAGKLELRRARIELQAVIEASLESVRTLIEQRGHELKLEVAAEPLCVDGDLDRLAQVVSNLLSNAAKYTDPGGTITLKLARQGDAAVISVRDTGIGIPPEDIGQVFDLFTQVRKHQDHAEGGLGIGLALVRDLARMHGGEVAAESAGADRGSTFEVRLPLATPTERDASQATSDPPRRAPCRRILIADDNADAAASLGTLLELEGHQIEIAHDGREAVEKAGRFHPDLAILDLGMPVVDGFEAGRAIRSLPGGGRVRLLALTGWGQEEDRRRTSEAGFDGHLVKPVDLARLSEMLRD